MVFLCGGLSSWISVGIDRDCGVQSFSVRYIAWGAVAGNMERICGNGDGTQGMGGDAGILSEDYAVA